MEEDKKGEESKGGKGMDKKKRSVEEREEKRSPWRLAKVGSRALLRPGSRRGGSPVRWLAGCSITQRREGRERGLRRPPPPPPSAAATSDSRVCCYGETWGYF